MWLNPQSWSVISGFASKEQSDKAMQSVADILDTPYGAKLLDPPYIDNYFDGALMHIFNPDTKENGGIFSQSQGWLILAESLLGHGDDAFRYFEESSPASMNDKAEQRVLEPYVHGQFTESTASPYAGRSLADRYCIHCYGRLRRGYLRYASGCRRSAYLPVHSGCMGWFHHGKILPWQAAVHHSQEPESRTERRCISDTER